MRFFVVQNLMFCHMEISSSSTRMSKYIIINNPDIGMAMPRWQHDFQSQRFDLKLTNLEAGVDSPLVYFVRKFLK